MALVVDSAAPTTPGFTAITPVASGIVLRGDGGSTNGPYDMQTSTNLALPLKQWTYSAFGQFDCNGNFVFTANAPGSNTPQQFYMLQLP